MGVLQWMRQETTAILTLGCLGTLTLTVAWAGSQAIDLDAKISALVDTKIRKEHPMQTLTQTVNNSAGEAVTVQTVRLDGESLADWIDRHKDAVAAVKAS